MAGRTECGAVYLNENRSVLFARQVCRGFAKTEKEDTMDGAVVCAD